MACAMRHPGWLLAGNRIISPWVAWVRTAKYSSGNLSTALCCVRDYIGGGAEETSQKRKKKKMLCIRNWFADLTWVFLNPSHRPIDPLRIHPSKSPPIYGINPLFSRYFHQKIRRRTPSYIPPIRRRAMAWVAMTTIPLVGRTRSCLSFARV